MWRMYAWHAQIALTRLTPDVSGTDRGRKGRLFRIPQFGRSYCRVTVRAFCAGIDFDVLNAMQGGSIGGITDLAAPTHGICNIFQYSAFVWQTVPVPVIAAVHGYALGGGLEIALGADIRYVTPDTRFAVKEVVMGLIPDVGGIVYMRDLARADIVRELMFTGREFDGNAAVEYGLATRTMDDPLAGAWSTAKEIACKSPDAIRALNAWQHWVMTRVINLCFWPKEPSNRHWWGPKIRPRRCRLTSKSVQRISSNPDTRDR